MNTSIERKEYDFWDLIIKSVSTVLTVGTLIVGVSTFLGNQEKEIKQRELEYRKELYSTQRTYYSQMEDIIGELSIFSETGDFDTAFEVKQKEFKKMYYGRLNIVESREVDSALSSFKKTLDQRIVPNSLVDDTKFQKERNAVHRAFRNSLRKTGDIKLDTLLTK